MRTLKKPWQLIQKTIQEWNEDKAPRLAAALAYYTGFSLAPILVIAIAVASLFYERAAVQNLVIEQVTALAGPQSGELVNSMLTASQNLGSNLLAAGIGLVALVFGAIGVFGQLQDALNTMWEVAPKPDQGLMGRLKDRLLSFAMVLSIGFLLLVSLVVSTVLAAIENWGMGVFPGFGTAIQIINFVLSIFIITVLYALLFKYVPDAEVQWKDVWLGAAVSAVLFSIGKALIGLYLGNSDSMAQFGAAGALVAILVWVYYSAQISFLGAEFTQVYANTYGSRVVPAEDAVALSEEARRQQGIPTDEQLQKAQTQRPAEAEFPEFSGSLPVNRKKPAEITAAPRSRSGNHILRSLAGSFLAMLLVGLISGYILGSTE